MKPLTERKFNNYRCLSRMLDEISRLLLGCYPTHQRIKEHLNDEICKQPAINFVINRLVEENPDFVRKVDNGFVIRMIAPESKNESDPIVDALEIHLVKDLPWIKQIVDGAMSSLMNQ